MRRLMILAVVISTPALAQTIHSEDATITGSGPVISADRVPVALPNGQVVYQDVTATASADAQGQLTWHVASVASAPIIVGGFKAGIYASSSGAASKPFLLQVTGPTPEPGNISAWSAAVTSDSAACAMPNGATWYTGPVKSNPLRPRLSAAQLPDGPSYGTGGQAGCYKNAVWPTGGILAVQQTGAGLSFTSFDDAGKILTSVTYTLSP